MSHRRRVVTHRSKSLPALLTVVSAALLIVATGCTQNPYLAGTPVGSRGPVATWGQPGGATVAAGEARLAELSRRVQLLDDNNRQLHIQLAQSEQTARVHQDEADLLRQQLGEMNTQLQSVAIAARQSAVQSAVQSQMAASNIAGGDGSGFGNGGGLGRQASATLPPRQPPPAVPQTMPQAAAPSPPPMRANTNLSQNASRLRVGFPVETEGNVVRIVVPADQLFTPGSAQFHSQAAPILDPIAAQLRSLFPGHRIGIEGYTDQSGSPPARSHELTAAQASAVLNQMSTRGGIAPGQLFTVAQGSNNPRANNVTPAGRAANRRIEIVVYP